MLRDPFTENISEPLPVMLWRARPDMSCEFVSRQWRDYTGYSEEQALGDGWSRCVNPEDLSRWLDICVRSFDSREPFEIEYRLRRRDGEYRWMLERGLPRYSKDGVFLGFVGTCIDIDERKHAEHEMSRSLERERKLRAATEEASRLKDGFIATVLLDLQSPVQAIATWAAHLRRQVPAASEAAEGLDAIEHNARAQDRIISSLLDLARVGAGKPSLTRGTVGEPLLMGVRVLVFDDDAGAREAMTKVLGIAGAETRGAGSTAEAMEALSAFHPDVMLSDGGAQAGAGYVSIRAVRSLTAERAVAAAGHDTQLAKPVEPVALLATVARLAQPVGM